MTHDFWGQKWKDVWEKNLEMHIEQYNFFEELIIWLSMMISSVTSIFHLNLT